MRSSRAPLVLSVGLMLGSMLACDTESALTEVAKPAMTDELPAPQGEEAPAEGKPQIDPNEAEKLPSPDAAYPNDASSRADCLAKCAEGEKSEDDQATCRLSCGHEASPEQAQVRRYVDCHRACGEAGAADCESRCRKALFSSLTKHDALEPKCSAPCFDELNGCETECATIEPADARATCALHCESEGARCLAACSPTG